MAMMGPAMEKSPPQTPAARLQTTVSPSVTRKVLLPAKKRSQPPSKISTPPKATVTSRKSMDPMSRMTRTLETV